MNYPNFLKEGDTIGICAPSGGIVGCDKIKRLEEAERQLEELGYKVIETESVRKEEKGRSASAKQRAKEFMDLLENDDIKLILFATGGDFLVEILEFLDFDYIKKLRTKWLQGYSDITNLGFLFNTILDIPTMYCQTIKDYAMRPLFRNLTDALEIEKGNSVMQYSFEKHEKVVDFRNEEVSVNSAECLEGQEEIEFVEEGECDVTKGYDLTEDVEWKNVTGENKIQIKGRSIGGCLDCIKTLIGTKYDNVKDYINKHRKDGIIWFLEVFEMSTSELYRTLWQMKNSGYFENCTGIVFGRPLFIRNEYDTDFNQTVIDVLKDLKIPIICDADIGHVSPQMAIVNGAILEITSENGKGKVKTFYK